MQSIYVIIGPTASGKSDRAVELALEIGGEVISADSRQVYKGLDVGTGKITETEMKGVTHHLLSYVEPKVEGTEYNLYSVSKWVKDAKFIIDDIINRDKVPIICGGTGMYIYSLIYGLDHDIAPDNELRNKLNHLSTVELFNKYKAINGEPADNSISNNRPRLIRSIEIGKVNKKENRQPLYNVKYIRLERSKEDLRERITRRAEQRLDAIVDEVNKLLAAGVDPNWLSRVGIEYGAILSGSLPLGEGWGGNKEKIISLILLRSLQYAKRQNTWNKKYCA